jgi:hypothetical protein
VVERPRVGDRCFISHFTRGLRGDWITWRPGRALRWKVEDRRLGRSGSVMSKPAPPRLCSPPSLVSHKDRWVGPREKVLNVPIACRRYGPGKPSSWPSTEEWFCPHYFNGCLGRETGYGPVDRSPGVLWIVSGALFLRSSSPTQLC